MLLRVKQESWSSHNSCGSFQINLVLYERNSPQKSSGASSDAFGSGCFSLLNLVFGTASFTLLLVLKTHTVDPIHERN